MIVEVITRLKALAICIQNRSYFAIRCAIWRALVWYADAHFLNFTKSFSKSFSNPLRLLTFA